MTLIPKLQIFVPLFPPPVIKANGLDLASDPSYYPSWRLRYFSQGV